MGQGRLGVEVFFVISGFILPYALSQSRYTLARYPNFIFRRLIRLEPPYLVSLAVTVFLIVAGQSLPGFRGGHVSISFARLLSHFGYLCDLLGYGWYNLVYWTLAIEFQYYLLIGLLFPMIASRSVLVSLTTVAGLAGLAIAIPSPALVFHWICPFLLGMVVFQRRSCLIGPWQFLIRSTLIGSATAITIGVPALLVSGIAACLIYLVQMKPGKFFTFLGAISYSLYLVHFPVGSRALNFASRYGDSAWAAVATGLFALLMSLLAAFFLFRFVELPSQHLASRMQSPTKLRGTSLPAETILPAGP